MVYIAPIVEGHGEIEALPALLHRIRGSLRTSTALQINTPIRIKSGSFLNDTIYFERHVAFAAAKATQRHGSVFILLDCDDYSHCPAQLGPQLLRNATAVRSDVPVFVALAPREYETWFLAAAHSLRGVAGLPDSLEPPPNLERIRDAKGWLSERMPGKYDPIRHQALFSKRMDLGAARTVQSFDRLYLYMARLLEMESTHP